MIFFFFSQKFNFIEKILPPPSPLSPVPPPPLSLVPVSSPPRGAASVLPPAAASPLRASRPVHVPVEETWVISLFRLPHGPCRGSNLSSCPRETVTLTTRPQR